MIGDILSAISLGRRLVETIADLRRDIQSVRPGGARKDVHAGRFEAWRAGSTASNRKPKNTTLKWPSWSKA